jgi:hypothetical protein
MAVQGLRDYVYRVVDVFPSFLKTPARWVADRIFGVWDEIFQALSMFRPIWLFFQGHMQAFISATLWLAEECGRSLRWVASIALPRWANWALDTGVRFMLEQVGRLRTWVEDTITWWRTQIFAVIDAVKAFAQGVYQWAVDRIRDVWATLTVIRDRVVQLLTHPDVFVDWVFAALWQRFWRFLNDHAEAIAGAGWARRDVIIAQAVRRFEEWIVRVL